MQVSTCSKGREGENAAAVYLENEGFTILQRNFRAPGGEIDIIGVLDNTIIFFEIKTVPRDRFDQIEYILNRGKMGRIIRTSKKFLYNNTKYQEYPVRYDLLCCDGAGHIHRHVENAFFEEGIG